MVTSAPSYLDYVYLMDSLKRYASPKSKLTTMIRAGKVIKLRRGLFLPENDTAYSLKTLANKIYGPSYLSFETALSFYGLIPEHVESLMSATFKKYKNKQFKTPVGSFFYSDIPARVYPYGVVLMEENGQPFLLATREKALCDTLSKRSGIQNLQDMTTLLLNDLRLDKTELLALNQKDLAFLIPLYQKKKMCLLLDFIQEESRHA